MKKNLKRCWVYRMYAFTTVLIISLTISAPGLDQARNSNNDEFALEKIEAQKKNQCISCLQQQISEKKENEKVLISIPNMSGPLMPDAPDTNSANNSNRYDPPLLETQTPVTIEHCVTDYNPSFDSSVMDSIIATNCTGLELPVQFSGFYPRDELHEHSEATYIAGEIHIDKYIKEVVSIPNNQRNIYLFII